MVVENKAETGSTVFNELKTDARTERGKQWSGEAEDISKRMNLNGSRTSELLSHGVLRKKNTSREVDTIHHEEKKEVSGASSSTISETTRHVKEEADNDFFKERRKVVDLNSSIISDLAFHEDPWEEAYPCEKKKKAHKQRYLNSIRLGKPGGSMEKTHESRGR